jgi:NAD(P)-dependent dehydrogenase (short-subunit alcohol dehydrogenase family)
MNERGDFDLSGKVALITGGAGILGQAFCRGLARNGAKLAVVDIDTEAAKRTAKAIAAEFGTETMGVGCDITGPAEVADMTAAVTDRYGGIDILHNNAAAKTADLGAFFAPFEDYDLRTWREVMAVNIDAMFLVAQSVGKAMVDRKQGGSIIQTSSIYGILAPDQRIYEGSEYMGRPINTPPSYSVSKAAVVGLTNYLSTYWADANIRVNTLTPGGVESGQNEMFKEKYSARIPLGRMADADEIVGALVFLASDASSYITGQNIVVDGGLSVW